jgi:hypothetical protein
LTGLLVAPTSRLRQGAGDGAEGVTDLGSEQAHDCDHDDSDESQDDCILDQTLTFFLGCEKHDIYSFLINWLPEEQPQNYLKYIRFEKIFKPAERILIYKIVSLLVSY